MKVHLTSKQNYLGKDFKTKFRIASEPSCDTDFYLQTYMFMFMYSCFDLACYSPT